MPYKLLIFFAFLGSLLTAALKPSSMFGDHMVLQRDMPVPVWGTAEPGEQVKVSFADQSVICTANKDGKWRADLKALKASDKGRQLIIEGSTKITFKDVLVGEVWICSGQYNMAMGWNKVKELQAIKSDALKKPIRTFNVPTFVSFTPQENSKGSWTTKLPSSAVAFGFSYYLNKQLDVPVAVILTSWGSSSIEGWMPLDLTEKLPHYKKIMADFEKNDKAKVAALIERGIKSGKGAKAWQRKENIYIRTRPNILYNAMLHPIIPFACRGMVWYQGEANSKLYKDYAKSLPIWVKRLRSAWKKDDFHFMAVMLPGFGRDNGRPDAKSWAWFRDVQMQIHKLPHTAVANTIDLGSERNIHPIDKGPIGVRLALLASAEIHKKDFVPKGPLYKSFKVNGSKMTISFDYATGLKTKDSKSPSGFWLADKKGSWHKAKATIKGSSIILESEAIETPVACRYAFSGKPSVNLVNGANLPAYPFRTDNWER